MKRILSESLNRNTFSRSLFFKGVQLFAVVILATTQINGQAPQKISDSFKAKKFYSATVDSQNKVWFLTDAGIVSYDGKAWSLHNNPAVPSEGLKEIKFNATASGGELLLATASGAKVAALPLDANSKVESYAKANSQILSDNVLSVSAKGNLKWFSTDKGISAFKDGKWLTNQYDNLIPDDIFEYFVVTSSAPSLTGDTLYAATTGAGVLRVFTGKVDAVSGASEYAEWGPIIMPSDNVLYIYLQPNGVQWLGTDKGIAKHTGYDTLDNWEVFDTESGLVDNEVRVINSDKKGNLWFGTKSGLSMFDGSKWTTYKTDSGLASNEVLSITVDGNDVVWVGTDNGVTCISNGKLVSFQ